jgi:hypothetical protein
MSAALDCNWFDIGFRPVACLEVRVGGMSSALPDWRGQPRQRQTEESQGRPKLVRREGESLVTRVT